MAKMSTQAESWVVYLMTLRHQQIGMRAVCEQREWDKMEQAQPGHHKLIQCGIATEREAELLARGTSGDPPPKRAKPASAATEPTRRYPPGRHEKGEK
jgi:hypothetical protein